jgi:hypothetical protein
MFGVLINVASSSQNPNGRGRIFKDNAFEYLPIPENQETVERIPTYRDLGFVNIRFPDLRAHIDPEFQTFTYGHVKRGFGDIQRIAELKRDDALFFYATLQHNSNWSPFIIGYFVNLEVYDCRKLSKEEIKEFSSCGFENNAHLKRIDPQVDFLIKGGVGSRKLSRAFPLAEEDSHLTLQKKLQEIVFTSTDKKIKSGTPWFRWTLTCNNSLKLLKIIEAWQKP